MGTVSRHDSDGEPRLCARNLTDGSHVDFADLIDRLYDGDADPADYEVSVEYLTSGAL